MTSRTCIERIIASANTRTSYYYREREREAAALTMMVCVALIGLLAFGCLIFKGCQPSPAVADCLCEQCGQVITDADHGRCQGTEVAACE